MKLAPTQLDEASLLRLGAEAVSLLDHRDFQSLADRFGYAVALGRNPAKAIEKDLRACVAKRSGSSPQDPAILPSMAVKYFPPNDANLFAVIESVTISADGCPVLVELVVTTAGEDYHLTLEQVGLAST